MGGQPHKAIRPLNRLTPHGRYGYLVAVLYVFFTCQSFLRLPRLPRLSSSNTSISAANINILVCISKWLIGVTPPYRMSESGGSVEGRANIYMMHAL